MAIYYFDSSALVKRYADEAGRDEVLLILSLHARRVYTSVLAEVEVTSALTRRGHRARARAGVIDAIVSTCQRHFQTLYRVVDVTRPVVEVASSRARRHRLRGYDAVHLATALELRREATARGEAIVTFVSADHDLNDAARAEGLDVIDSSAEA